MGVSAHPSRVTVDEVATVKGPVQINAAGELSCRSENTTYVQM